MARIEIKELNLGGIADSDYLGARGSVAEAVGLDIHSVAGLMSLNQKLTKESGATIDAFVKCGVSCSDGKQYFFSSTSGKIWSRTAGTYALEATASPAAGSAGILGAMEYQGYLYYAMQSRLGRWQIGTSWGGRNDSYGTFTNTDAEFHPMKIVNLVLYIGDKNFVAQVDTGTFTANALDIKSPLRIKALGRMDTDLLIGTFVADNVTETEILRWNTWSVSYSVADTLPEVGVNAFLETDNVTIINAGVKGNLYEYDGVRASLKKTIKGDWSSTNKAYVHPNAAFNFHGLPLFGLSQITGTGVNLGVYGYGRTNANYPYVLNLDFPISERSDTALVLTAIEIGCIIGGGDQFFVSWKNGSSFGIDKLDTALKLETGYFITRVASVDRVMQDNYGQVYVPYRALPSGTSIKIYRKVNHASGGFTEFNASTEMVTDVDRMMRHSLIDIGAANTVQIKTELTSTNNNTPEVESAIFDVNKQ